jgi:cyclic-di-AMP phosphodiesterase PgpH
MPNRNSELENDNELKFSGEQGFFDKSQAIRYLILFLLAFSIFIFLHFREVRVEVLEINSIAPGYSVAQVDFDFVDDEATLILKQEAVRDIGKIYQISEQDIRRKRIEFENLLLYNQGWRQQAESGTFDGLYQGVERLERALLQLRFTDEQTFRKMEEVGMSIAHYQLYTPKSLLDPVFLPAYVWESVEDDYFFSEANRLTTDLVIEFFKNSQWRLEEDIPAQRLLRKRVQAQVPEKITHVNAGSRLIDQGEKVTARHVAMLQAMKNELSHSRNLSQPLPILGSLLMTLLLVGICVVYFKINYPRLLTSNRKLFLLVTIIVLVLGISKATEFFLLNSKHNLIEVVRYPLFVPLAAILLCSLMNPGIATFVSGFLAIVLSMTLAFDREGFLLVNLAGAFVAILSTHSLKRRKEIVVVCLKAWLFCVAVILALHFYANALWNVTTVIDILVAFIFMLLTAVLVVGLLPLLESGFRIMTNVTLMEYMDPNNDLLRRLTLEAPGTYQHSVVVGNLAEAAALAIGANGLFCRVATLYHDIGKMTTSQYYTENQMGDVNIHQLLTPQESAQVIMAHVPEGVAMAREANLPEPIIDIIKEHHGTTLVYYFYRKQLEKVGGDKSKVDEREFRYSGPKPRSKESGIIMIADSFEAASRSLDKVNEDTLIELVNRLVRDKFDDGQFDECLLTFEELSIVKKMLVKTLLAAGHSRIKYPSTEKSHSSLQIEESA